MASRSTTGPLIEAIESFRLVRPDGDVVTVSRESNAELFRAAIGGHGLFGPMVDVTLRLVPDRLVEKSEIVFMNVEPLLASYIDRVNRDRKSVPLCYGFVPAPKFAAFLKQAGAIFTKYQDDLPVMANHFRFVPASSESLMAFAPEDSICLIPFYLARKDDKAWQGKLERATGELLDACLECGGRHYLTFDIIASQDQFRRAYPQLSEFFALKRKYDPDEMFSSVFYQKYAR